MKGKRGSHVGVIASFTIFIMFLIGLYFSIQPLLKDQKDKDLLLDKLKDRLFDEMSNNLTVAVISTSSGTCLKLSNSDVDVSGARAIVKDDGGTEIISGYDGSNLIIQAGSQTALWVYYAQEFQVNSGVDTSCVSPAIKSVRQTYEIFEKKVADAVNNYAQIKASMNLQKFSDLGYSFEYNNGTSVSVGNPPSSGQIYAEEIPIQYINGKANSLSGKLTIKAW
ncbi:hypothetical protein HYT23_05210 [Candidatus Pacearchaeota archaeon]|nr:hypothetical protein [Candidatus Pacearchaeota archaeon]